MHTNLGPLVNICNLVTKTCYELGILYGPNSSILDLHIQEFNKDPTNYIKLVYGRIVGDT
jgi:hypothetical protein